MINWMRFFNRRRRMAETSESGGVSQMQRDNVLSVMSIGLIIVDGSGCIQRINTQAQEDLKLHECDVVGRKMSEFFGIYHDKQEILSEQLSLVSGGRQFVELPANTYIRRSEPDDKFYIKGQFVGEYDHGKLTCLYFLFRNIEGELTQEYVLDMALNDTKIFPWFFDMERNRMIIDARWFAHLGIPAGDCTLTSEEFAAMLHPEDRDGLIEALMMQLSGKLNTDFFTYRLRRADGEWEWFQEKSVHLGQVDGAPYRIVGICQSIHGHKTIEQNLIAARDRAQESDRLKSAFLMNMSHEIRTPLNAIVGFSNLLTKGEIPIDSTEGREFVGLINSNCNQLLSLISNVLDLSKIESGTMEYHFAESRLNRFLTDIHRNHSQNVRSDVEFNLILPDTDAMIVTDLVRLQQIFDNLLSNAEKFTSAGRIDFGYTVDGHTRNVELFVEDTGCGIPEDKREDIFERFFKLDTFVQGAGLGLPICRTIAERLGGTISVTSRIGEGSRFTVTLPLDGKS